MQVDVLTGSLVVHRTDLVEDTGTAISPEVDVGQVEGGLVMGQGLWTTEQVRHKPNMIMLMIVIMVIINTDSAPPRDRPSAGQQLLALQGADPPGRAGRPEDHVLQQRRQQQRGARLQGDRGAERAGRGRGAVRRQDGGQVG